MLSLFKKVATRRKQKGNRPLLLAHRGARKLAPENTLAAFKKAIDLGFDGVELDVVMTKDRVPVVFHGNDLSHSTRATGNIHETLSYDIEKIDAGALFSPRFEGERIPTLASALDLFSKSDIFVNIELKSQPHTTSGMEENVANMIHFYQLSDRVLISSFSPLMLKRFNRIAPNIPTALLVGPHPFFLLKTLLFANMLNISAVNPYFQYTSKRLMSFAENREWDVFVWTVNTKQEYRRAIELGVHGIITDEPELIKM